MHCLATSDVQQSCQLHMSVQQPSCHNQILSCCTYIQGHSVQNGGCVGVQQHRRCATVIKEPSVQHDAIALLSVSSICHSRALVKQPGPANTRCTKHITNCISSSAALALQTNMGPCDRDSDSPMRFILIVIRADHKYQQHAASNTPALSTLGSHCLAHPQQPQKLALLVISSFQSNMCAISCSRCGS